jgi:Zn-dependent protease
VPPTPPKPRRGLVIGRFGGAPIVAHGGWLVATVLLAFVAAPIARRAVPTLDAGAAYLVGAGFAVLLLGSVLLHELAHAAVARHRGVEVRQISLTLVGGHTEMAQATTPGTSAAIAVAGPFTNLVVAAVAWWAWQAAPPGSVVALLLALAASSNALVTAFNLLPGLPMDGGWILEALVWRVSGHRSTGTVAAAWIGRVVAVGLLAYTLALPVVTGIRPVVTEVVWAAVIGSMLWTSAGASLRGAAWERSVAGFSVTELAVPAVVLPATATLADVPTDGHDVVVVGVDGAPLGYLDTAALAAVPPDHRGATPLAAALVALPSSAVVDSELRGREAIAAIAQAARTSPVMAVRSAGGPVTGLLRYTDVVRRLRPGS